MTAQARRLYLVRRLVAAYATGFCLLRLPHLLSLAGDDAVRFRPIGVLAPFDRPLPAVLWWAIVAAALVAGFAVVADVAARFTLPALAIAVLLVATYRSSWGQVFHTENLLVLHLLLLAAAALFPRLLEPAFALRLLVLVTVTAYVVSGLAKLRAGGWSWLDGETLRHQVAFDNVRKEVLGSVSSPLAGPVLRQAWLFPPLAAATLLVELGSPLALLGRRAGMAWAAAAWTFHAGVGLLMAIVFAYPLVGVAFAPLLPLETVRTPDWVRPRRRPRR